MNFEKWLETYIDEKGLSAEIIEVEGESGTNIIPLEILVDHINHSSKSDKEGIKNMLVRLDFANKSPMDFFKHIAQAIAQ